MPKTVLFIDDDQRIQELLTEYFNKNNFNTLSALTGEAGIEILKVDAQVFYD